jgi:hypothetical protein
MKDDAILPGLRSCLLCEDVRCEFNGMRTLVGVVNVIPAPVAPGQLPSALYLVALGATTERTQP